MSLAKQFINAKQKSRQLLGVSLAKQFIEAKQKSRQLLGVSLAKQGESC